MCYSNFSHTFRQLNTPLVLNLSLRSNKKNNLSLSSQEHLRRQKNAEELDRRRQTRWQAAMELEEEDSLEGGGPQTHQRSAISPAARTQQQ
jgi:hypothetical protein